MRGLFSGSRLVLLPACRTAADSDILAQLLNRGGTNAAYVLQIVHGLERPLLLAIVDDRLGFGRADSLKTFQFGLASGIDIDSRECRSAKYEQRNKEKKQFGHIFSKFDHAASCSLSEKATSERNIIIHIIKPGAASGGRPATG